MAPDFICLWPASSKVISELTVMPLLNYLTFNSSPCVVYCQISVKNITDGNYYCYCLEIVAVFVDLTLHVVDLPEGDRVVVGLHALPPSGDGVVVVPLVSQGLAFD